MVKKKLKTKVSAKEYKILADEFENNMPEDSKSNLFGPESDPDSNSYNYELTNFRKSLNQFLVRKGYALDGISENDIFQQIKSRLISGQELKKKLEQHGVDYNSMFKPR
jgi:hypothetical protein